MTSTCTCHVDDWLILTMFAWKVNKFARKLKYVYDKCTCIWISGSTYMWSEQLHVKCLV